MDREVLTQFLALVVLANLAALTFVLGGAARGAGSPGRPAPDRPPPAPAAAERTRFRPRLTWEEVVAAESARSGRVGGRRGP